MAVPPQCPLVQGTQVSGASLEYTPQQTCQPWCSAEGPEATITAQHRTSQLHVAAPNLATDNQQPRLWLPRDLLLQWLILLILS